MSRDSGKVRSLKQRKHKTVQVSVGQLSAEIDRKMAPLIRALWGLGISTCNSCENGVDGRPWIEFFTADDAEAFLNLVSQFSEDPDSVYERTRCAWGDSPDFWQYSAYVNDYGVLDTETNGEITESFKGTHEFIFSISIRFPQKDLAGVTARMVKLAADAEVLTPGEYD